MVNTRDQKIALFLFADGEAQGGVSRALVNLASAFARRGLATDLVVTGSVTRQPVGLEQQVRLVELNQRGLRRAFRPLVGYLRRERPTVMLSAMEHPNILAIAARSVARVPLRLVVCTQGHLSERLRLSYGPRDRILLPPMVRFAYRRANSVVAVSRGVAEDLSHFLGGSASAIVPIYNPIVDHTFPVRMREPIAHPWLNQDVIPVFLAAGRLTASKDYPTLIRAFALVRRQRDARLLVLGEGDARSQLEQLSLHLELGDSVDFHGHVDDPLPYMSKANVFVHSARWEGFGNVVVESLACGCPVVSTDCPTGPAEILADGEYGRLVPVGDPRSLADAMISALSEQHDRDRLVARANEFRVDAIAGQYLTVFGIPLEPHD